MLLFMRDVEKTCSIIQENFDIEERHNTFDRLTQDQFGYSSIHFILKLKSHWLSVPTIAPYDGLKAEIQALIYFPQTPLA